MRKLVTITGTPATKQMVVKEIVSGLGKFALGYAVNYAAISFLVRAMNTSAQTKNYMSTIEKM